MKLKPQAKILIGVIFLLLVGVGLWQAKENPTIQKLIPKAPEPGTVSSDDFGTSPTVNGQDIAASDSKTINVGIVTWGGYAGGIVANNGFTATENSIFFKKYGHKVNLIVVDDFEQSRAAFASGKLDLVWSTVDAFALEYPALKKKGLNPKAILQYDWSRGGDAIAATKDIQSISDLKGKRVAVAEATPSHYFGLWALAQGGVRTSDVDWVFTKSAPEAANLFKAGTVDAAISWSPDVYIAADAKGKILISTREATNLIADIFVARGEFLDRRPEAARAFVQGWLEGTEEAKKNPQKAIRLMAENFQGIGISDAEGMWHDVYLPNYQENARFFGVNGEKDPTGFQAIFDTSSRIWTKVGLANETGNSREAFNAQFLKGVSKEAQKSTPEPKKEFKPAPQAKVKAKAVLSKRVSVYFPTGSSTLDDNAKYIIDNEVSGLTNTFNNAYIRISGNTDNVGNRNFNIDLSKKRANSVMNYLVGKYRFPKNKFIVVGNGPDKPVAKNDTERNRSKNRRTDFEVIPQ